MKVGKRENGEKEEMKINEKKKRKIEKEEK